MGGTRLRGVPVYAAKACAVQRQGSNVGVFGLSGLQDWWHAMEVAASATRRAASAPSCAPGAQL